MQFDHDLIDSAEHHKDKYSVKEHRNGGRMCGIALPFHLNDPEGVYRKDQQAEQNGSEADYWGRCGVGPGWIYC